MKTFNLILYLAYSLFGVSVTPAVNENTPTIIEPVSPPAIVEEINTRELAECLTDSGAKFYGAYWCGHCGNQKALFGEDIQYVTYVECDPGGENSDTAACREAGIEAYPTWILGDGTKLVGTQQLESLATKASCQQ